MKRGDYKLTKNRGLPPFLLFKERIELEGQLGSNEQSEKLHESACNRDGTQWVTG